MCSLLLADGEFSWLHPILTDEIPSWTGTHFLSYFISNLLSLRLRAWEMVCSLLPFAG